MKALWKMCKPVVLIICTIIYTFSGTHYDSYFLDNASPQLLQRDLHLEYSTCLSKRDDI